MDGAERLREDGLTCEQIAAELGVSRVRVQQLERQALRKARRWCEAHGLAFEDLTSAWPQPERVRRDWRDY